jgi:hypothetical protein
MKPGKNKDSYFSSDDICSQAEEAMEIARQYYPQYEHVFIYDNATTHLKRAPDALSARRMPKKSRSLERIGVSKRQSGIP